MRQAPVDPVRPSGGRTPQRQVPPLSPSASPAPSASRPDLPRPLISQSWHRVLEHGVDQAHGSQPQPLPVDEIEQRRSRSPLSGALPLVRETLGSAAYADGHLMMVTDAEGRLLWREGDMARRRSADRYGIVQGSAWSEEAAGTNAIGTSLVLRAPVQVSAAEHYVRALQRLYCAAAPIHDPSDGRLLGAVNVTGPATAAPVMALALVTAVARAAEGELRCRHWAAIDGLRSVAAPLLARIPGRAAVVDRNGWVAAVTGMPPLERLALPAGAQAGPLWLPSLGACLLEPVPGGWLVRLGSKEADRPVRVLLDVSHPRSWSLTVQGRAGSWERQLSPRHAELLFVLAVHPEGRSAAQLACDLFGDPSRTVTVRAELSRLRRTLAGVLAHRPYRFADGVLVELVPPAAPDELLPHSCAPAVTMARRAKRG
jgi:hypothetical protein